jgi:nucleoside-diphosphate-sugar epimerase
MPKVFITGHQGMVGSAVVRAIKKSYTDWSILLADRKKLDLLDQSFFLRKDLILSSMQQLKLEVFMPIRLTLQNLCIRTCFLMPT